jgi:hypothetical protein
MYHVISPVPLQHVQHLYAYKSPDTFENDMAYIANHCDVVSFEDVLCGVIYKPGRRVPVLVSFDDGLTECFDYVRPILLSRGIPCVFFICKAFIDNRRAFYRHLISLCIASLNGSLCTLLDSKAILNELRKVRGQPFVNGEEGVRWLRSLTHKDEQILEQACLTLNVEESQFLATKPYLTSHQIKTLARDGFTIGGHSRHHAQLDERSGATVIEEEVVESCDAIRQITGARTVPFAFPFSGKRVPRTILSDISTRHPFIPLYFDSHGLIADEPFVINRVPSDNPGTSSIEELVAMATQLRS